MDPSGKRTELEPADRRCGDNMHKIADEFGVGTGDGASGSRLMAYALTRRRPDAGLRSVVRGAGRHGQVTLIRKWYLHLIIAHQGRLVRFSFQGFERFCAEHVTELLVLNNEKLSPEQEMALLTIAHCFSARLACATIARS
jgi:hypothetical protein